MNPLDKNYLLKQFKNKIYSKNGTEFQSFFEDIIEKAYPDFKKIKPYGPEGDRGNDGYRKNSGIYYQVYSPEEPRINLAKAAKKFKEDFEKLKKNWDKISKIKEYFFVFNNKYFGSIQKIEKVLSKLEKDNREIKFHIFTSQNLEKLFFSFDKSDILTLGFDIDSTKAVSNAYEYLKTVKIELDRENGKFALRTLKHIKNIVFNLNDNQLELEYELLECSCLRKLEEIKEAKEKYENIYKRFPNDSRSLLYLAEIYLLIENYKKNKEFLEKAEEVDVNCWLLKLEKLIRKIHLKEKNDINNIMEENFPEEPRIKENFYRVYASIFMNYGKKTEANSFIEKAIFYNPNRFRNYLGKLRIIEEEIYLKDNSKIAEDLIKHLKEIEKIENEFLMYGDIGARNKACLNINKLNVFQLQKDFSSLQKISKNTFELALNCYFDKEIDNIFAITLKFFSLSDENIKKLLNHLAQAEKGISDELAKSLIYQFNIRNRLLEEGEEFFKTLNKQRYLEFIDNIDKSNDKNVLKFLKNDLQFAIVLAKTLKNYPILREKIIQNLPDDKKILKDKLLLEFNYDEGNIDDAFDILQKIDLSGLDYYDTIIASKVAEKREAWEFQVILFEKLLGEEKDKKNIFYLKSQLFIAEYSLENYLESIKIGEELLEYDLSENILDKKNKEELLAQTINACLKRGILDRKNFEKAKQLLTTYSLSQFTFEFKIGIEAEVYLFNDDPQKALESVIEGVKIKKILSLQEYANLYFLVNIKIGKLIKLNLDSLVKVKQNLFVKLKNQNKWYFIGNDCELDAIKILEENEIYSFFVNKKVGDKIIFRNKYGSETHEEIIENIFPIEKYILWQSIQNFQKLSQDNILNGVQTIEIPKKEQTIDLKYLIAFFKDLHSKTKPFFEMYCKGRVPLAMLAVSEGGLTNAIGQIVNENKGFINFSSGNLSELEMQKNIAKKIIELKLPFYLDGTSALVLSETGLLKKVYPYINNLKVSQSIIDLLIRIADKFKYSYGKTGYMMYSQEKIIVSTIKKERRELIKSNFTESINLLESNSKNISFISQANKADCCSEQKIPAELCDACILAQKEGIPVLTEDFLYLKMNEIETEKTSPAYFSSLILLKVLNEQGKISFDEYLDFFAYLSSYRFRFLPISSNDLERAVFGDRRIKVVNSENIRKLNFTLTLSEEYGVSFQVAFALVAKFLYKVLIDDTIMPDIVEKIFVEIIESFSMEKDEKNLGQMLLRICTKAVEKNKSRLILTRMSKITQEKIDRLSKVTEIFSSGIKIWTSNTK